MHILPACRANLSDSGRQDDSAAFTMRATAGGMKRNRGGRNHDAKDADRAQDR
jgi:hypothetical protein